MSNLKRILTIAFSGVILFSTISFGRAGTVNAPNGLVLRESASKSANPITTISDNSTVDILEENGEWYKVKYNDKEGYLFAEYVDAEKEEAKEEPQESTEEQKEETKTDDTEKSENIANEPQYPQKQKAKSDLKIYTIPSVTANTLVSVKKDEEITINYELNNWVNVTYGKNTGWARKYFVNNENVAVQITNTDNNEKEEITEETSKENKVTETKTIDNKKAYVDVSNSANIREKASTSSNIITTLLRNTEVTIIAEEGDFYKIQYQDITGYISKSLISEKPVA